MCDPIALDHILSTLAFVALAIVIVAIFGVLP